MGPGPTLPAPVQHKNIFVNVVIPVLSHGYVDVPPPWALVHLFLHLCNKGIDSGILLTKLATILQQLSVHFYSSNYFSKYFFMALFLNNVE